ncbi:MAG: hypothetical protein LBQ89_09680 [Treponema sp.]|jgi:hypothetical protein|nr:hypothetical protein [Treponema sp.]
MKFYLPLLIILSLFCFISAATCDPAVVMAIVDGVGQVAGSAADLAGELGAPEVSEALGIVSDVSRGSVASASGTEYENRQVTPESNEPVKYTITFTNNTDFFVSISGYGESITIPPRSDFSGPAMHSIQTEEQYRRGWDYDLIYNRNKVTWTPEGNRNVTFRDRKEFHGSYLDEETDVTEEHSSTEEYLAYNRNIPTDGSIENDPVNQQFGIHTDNPTPYSLDDQVESPNIAPQQPNYSLPYSLNDQVENPNIVPQQPNYSLPLISNFQQGMYYLQIGSYANVNAVYPEIAKIDNELPVAVMKVTVEINGINREVHRILIGPIGYEESLLLLRQFKVNYHDAFVWFGR